MQQEEMELEQAYQEWLSSQLSDDDFRKRVILLHPEILLPLNLYNISQQRPLSLSLLRLLRDITTTESMQTQAFQSGSLDRACALLGKEEEPHSLQSMALMFISNCIAGNASALARDFVWKSNFSFPRDVETNAKAAGMILYILCVVDSSSNNKRLGDILKHSPLTFQIVLDRHDDDSCMEWIVSHVLHNTPEYFSPQVFQHADLQLPQLIALLPREEKFPYAFTISLLQTTRNAELMSILGDQLLNDESLLHETSLQILTCMANKLVTFLGIPHPEVSPTLRVVAVILGRSTTSHSALQDHVRNAGGIQPILYWSSVIDPQNVAQREWALMALRECCLNNLATQALVYSMQQQQQKG